tara:strand:+ start:87 stop:428 length:342 start_codon:yes stop_codon:yes gene_type:complete
MKIKYCERVKGEALFVEKPYKKDDVIFVLDGDILVKPSKYSIEIAKDRHILDQWGVYMNHSFNPTTKICGEKVVAIKDLEIGDELNFNYNLNETKMATPFYTDDGTHVSGINK